MSMYADTNFQSKKALKEAVANSQKAVGKTRPVRYFQPGPFGGDEIQNGTIYLEGPWYPQPHKWYAKAIVKDGIIVKVV